MSNKVKKLNILSAKERKENFNRMYKGERQFSREQIVFMVEVIVASAFDQIDTQIQYINDQKYNKTILTYCDGVVDTAGMSLAILYAQLTGDGMSPGDVLEITKLGKEFENFVKFCKKNGHDAFVKKNNGRCTPYSQPIAEKIVTKLFETNL